MQVKIVSVSDLKKYGRMDAAFFMDNESFFEYYDIINGLESKK